MDRVDEIAKSAAEKIAQGRYYMRTDLPAEDAVVAAYADVIAAALRSYGDCRIEEAAKHFESMSDDRWYSDDVAKELRVLKTKSEPGEGKGG